MVMRMEEGLDTGPVALTERLAIGPDATAGELSQILSVKGAALMARALLMLEDGALVFMPQGEGVTYAQKIDKAEARIDWTKPATDLHDIVRGLAPAPGVFFEAQLGKGVERVKILRTEIIEASGGTPGRVLDAHLTDVRLRARRLAPSRIVMSGQGADAGRGVLRGVRLGEGALLASKTDAAL